MDFSIKTSQIINRCSTNSVKPQNVYYCENSKLQPLEADTCEFSRENAEDILKGNPLLEDYHCGTDKGFDFNDYEKYIKLVDGSYDRKATEILNELTLGKKTNLKNSEAIDILKKINVPNTDKEALMELRDIYKTHMRHLFETKFWEDCLEQDGSFTQKSLDDVKNILKRFPLNSPRSEKNFCAALAFRHYKDLTSLDELSVPEKNNLLKTLIEHPYSSHELLKTNEAYNEIPAFPKSKEEYKATMAKLIKDTSLKVEKPYYDFMIAYQSELSGIKNKNDNTIKEGIEYVFPEIGKIDNETISLLRKVVDDRRFDNLSDNDMLTLKLAVILRNSSSIQGVKDDKQSAYNAYYLSERLGLPHENKLKLYAILSNQNLLENAQSNHITFADVERSACELRHQNSLEMFKIFNDAKEVKTDAKDCVYEYMGKTVEKIKHKSSYRMTQTSLPKASQFIPNGDSVRIIKSNGIENTVVFFDKKTPIKYRDDKGNVKILEPKDVYNYCHATYNLQGVELATRPNSNYHMSSSFMNLGNAGSSYAKDGIIVKIERGNSLQDTIPQCTAGSTGWGKTGEADDFLRLCNNQGDSKTCDKYDGKELSELKDNPEAEKKLRIALDTHAADVRYGENISVHPDAIGVFHKGYMTEDEIEKVMDKSEKMEQYWYKIRGKKYEPNFDKYNGIPVEHRVYANENDLAIFHLGK